MLEAVRCILPLCRKVKRVKKWKFRHAVSCCRSVRRLLNGLDCCARCEQPDNLSKSVGLPMKGLERRRSPRTTMEKHAYINIEPNNGGIVLNVSDGGLCFHSFDPVQRNGKVRFWFWDHDQRIEADGTLAWTDETQKGGLRFTALPVEAREKIRDWISQPVAVAAGGSAAPASPQPRTFTVVSGSRPDPKVVLGDSAPLSVLPELRIPVPSSGFSRGLVTGLLLSAVVVAAVVFNSYRRELGESLIQLGERFAAKPQAQALAVPAATPVVLPTPQAKPPATPAVSTAPQVITSAAPASLPAPSSPVPKTVSPAPAPVSVSPPEKAQPHAEKLVAQPLVSPEKPQPAKLEPARLVATMPAATDPGPKVPAMAAAPAISLPPPTVSMPAAAPTPTSASAPATASASAPATGVAPASNLIPAKVAAAPKSELSSQPGLHTEDSTAENADATRELYFEVGKFKNVLQAHDETDKLAQLGFPATSVEKGHLWTNSFHVLVGPYPDEDQAKSTHENLVTSGFKPRPFEKGWRNLTLLSSVTLNGARAPEGEYTVSWESYVIGDASVKLMRNSSVVAAAGGRWVKRDVKYPRDAYVYKKNPDGSRTLIEIHFGGMRQALVFGKPS